MPSLSSPIVPTYSSNYILAALTPTELARVTPHLTPCLLHLGQTLYERGDSVDRIYFPKNGVISLVLSSQSGVDVEVGLIGREGSLGAPETLGGHSMKTRANVQIAGSGWRMAAKVLRDEFQTGGALQNAILRSSFSQLQQTSQCVLCNRLHSVERRLSRWLLMCQDRMQTPTLELTQEFLANMIGTRRVGVTLAAGTLRDAGVIEYTRGKVTITDRQGLEARACECYPLIREAFNLLVPPHESL